MRIQEHAKKCEQYEKLIYKLKYKKGNKSVDEFGLTECVICMDEFTNNQVIRKIPICKHIFHDECIMRWIKGEQQIEAQRCPMCNIEITPEAL